jgi:DNA-binding IclR family transcriptional regulator
VAKPISQSVLKAFAMLKCFDSPDQWLSNFELSRRANLPVALSYRMIQTMQEVGAAVRGPRGRYRPGILLVSLSQYVVIPELLHEASKSVATELAQRLDVTVHLGILEDGMVTYVTRATTHNSFQPHTRTGSQLEAYCTGLGKVLLAELLQDQLERVLHDGELVRMTPYTITNRAGNKGGHELYRRADPRSAGPRVRIPVGDGACRKHDRAAPCRTAAGADRLGRRDYPQNVSGRRGFYRLSGQPPRPVAGGLTVTTNREEGGVPWRLPQSTSGKSPKGLIPPGARASPLLPSPIPMA